MKHEKCHLECEWFTNYLCIGDIHRIAESLDLTTGVNSKSNNLRMSVINIIGRSIENLDYGPFKYPQ